MRSTRVAAGGSGTVSLELRLADGRPEVVLRRGNLAFLHPHCADAGGARSRVMSAEPVLAPDAAIVLGIASTAMPFARTPEAEAERWLRMLRSHGEVGLLLQALGVSDGSLQAPGEERPAGESQPTVEEQGGEDRDAVSQVAVEATSLAGRRGSVTIATADVLMAVMHVYGEDFDRVLRAHGTDRGAVLELLGAARATTDAGSEH